MVKILSSFNLALHELQVPKLPVISAHYRHKNT